MPPSIERVSNGGPVAQSGRALPLQGGGPGFKSRRVHLSAVPNLIWCEERRKQNRLIERLDFVINEVKHGEIAKIFYYNLIYYADDLACVAKKDVVSCDNLKVGAYFL